MFDFCASHVCAYKLNFLHFFINIGVCVSHAPRKKGADGVSEANHVEEGVFGSTHNEEDPHLNSDSYY